MSTDLSLGIDLGTSSCKVCYVDRHGRIIAGARAEYPVKSPQPGWMEQSATDWWPTVTTAVAAAAENAGVDRSSVRAVGLTSAAHIGVLLDERSEPIRPAILWNDQRSAHEVKQLQRSLGEVIFQATFNKVSTTWTLPHLLWIRDNDPESWRRKKRIVLSKDYLLWKLTGRFATDPGTALSSMLYDAASACWSDEICKAVDIDAALLPEVIGSTAIAGPLLDESARELGLTPGITVVTGSLDSATELYGAGVVDSGEGLIRLATAGGIELVTCEPQPHPLLICYPHPVDSLWYSQAGTSSCGSAVDWIAKVLGDAQSPVSYDRLNRIVEESPLGSGGVLFHPYLAGERCPYWNPKLRGSFVGLSLGSPSGHLARAVVEGVCFSIKEALSVFAGVERGGPLAVVGGGTNSRIWLQILSEVLDRTLVVRRNAESAYGAAILAAAGSAGQTAVAFRTFVQAGHNQEVITPQRRNVDLYEELFASYKLVYRRLCDVYD